jgi:hypothetical protein
MKRNYELHKEHVRDICALHGAKTSGWLQSFAEAVHVANGDSPKWQANWPLTEVKALIKEVAVNMLPDAYKIVPEQRKLIFWEVETSNYMPEWKIQRLGLLGMEVDDWGWDFELRLVDRYGNENTCHVIGAVTGTPRILSAWRYKRWSKEQKDKRKQRRENTNSLGSARIL